MNRRSFLQALAALPVVGALFKLEDVPECNMIHFGGGHTLWCDTGSRMKYLSFDPPLVFDGKGGVTQGGKPVSGYLDDHAR